MGLESVRLQQALTTRLFGDDAREDAVALGRYTVIAPLGRGGMGSVYRARDPELRREVALKVVEDAKIDAEQRAAIRERTIREAQILAQLSHPNIVGIHDVGEAPRGVFLAMELVTGSDLGSWLANHPPGTRARTRRALEMIHQAAAGLSVAHAAQVVHRDIKPTNLLLGRDGRVRVADFGLARVDEGRVESDVEVTLSSGVSSGLHSGEGSLTKTGAVVGTPAYMPPEQLRGGTVDRRSDVFSLCATAFELLTGHRPYLGRTVAALLDRIESGPPDPIPASARVPRAVESVLRKGLSPDPRRRWATMDDLSEALRSAEARPRRRMLAVGVPIAAAGALAAGSQLGGSEDSAYDRCVTNADRLTTLVNTQGGDTLEAHFAQTLPVGPQIHERVKAGLDRFATEWADTFNAACAATWTEATRSPERFDSTVRCLEQEEAKVEHLIATLAEGGRETLTAAPRVAWSLPSPRHCEDDDTTTPTDPDELEAWKSHMATLDEAKSLQALGQLEESRSKVEGALAAASKDELPDVRARALLQKAELVGITGEPDEAVALTDDALWSAVAVGADEIAARAAGRMAYLVGVEQGRFEDAMRWAERAESALKRIGGDGRLARDLRFYRAAIFKQWGKYDQALALLEPLVDEMGREEPEAPLRLANTQRTYGAVLAAMGEYEKAEATIREALELERETTGPFTADYPSGLMNLGGSMLPQGRYADAKELFEQAHETRKAILEPGTIGIAETQQMLAIVSHLLQDDETAETYARQAHETSVRVLGPEHPRSVAYGLDVVNALAGQERYAEALEYANPLVDAGKAAYGADSPRFSSVLGVRATAHIGLEQLDEAVADYLTVIDIRKKALGPKHPEVAKALRTLGAIRLERGDAQAAVEALREAHVIYEQTFGEEHAIAKKTKAELDEAEAELSGENPP